MNSVGVLPHQVLDADDRTKAFGMLHNTKQIKEQYDAHETKIKLSRFMFTPFDEFEKSQGMFLSTALFYLLYVLIVDTQN